MAGFLQSMLIVIFSYSGISAVAMASTLINIVILIAAFSVMIATYYSCIHMITSLAEAKKAPEIFLKITEKGAYKIVGLLLGHYDYF